VTHCTNNYHSNYFILIPYNCLQNFVQEGNSNKLLDYAMTRSVLHRLTLTTTTHCLYKARIITYKYFYLLVAEEIYLQKLLKFWYLNVWYKYSYK
jgi:hypothetical protein